MSIEGAGYIALKKPFLKSFFLLRSNLPGSNSVVGFGEPKEPDWAEESDAVMGRRASAQ